MGIVLVLVLVLVLAVAVVLDPTINRQANIICQGLSVKAEP
jgi:hypothetical protein